MVNGWFVDWNKVRTKQNAGHELEAHTMICETSISQRRAHNSYVLHLLPERLPRTTVSGSDFFFYYVWNMDIYLTKTHGFAAGGLYSPPGAMFYYRCARFISCLLDCWQKAPANPHCNAWRGEDIFLYTFDWRKKEESNRHIGGWVHHRLIFIFGWTKL